MSTSLLQRSFAGGELAPSLGARADQVKYATGLRTCRNFLVKREGGIQNRAGLRFLGAVKDSSQPTYLRPFIFSADQTYLIEVGDQYFRFYQHDAPVLPTGLAAYSAAVDYRLGDLVVDGAGRIYYCRTPTGPATAVHALSDGAVWYPLSSAILEIPTPYRTADLPLLQFAQQNDVVLVTHQAYGPKELRRLGAASWTLLDYNESPVIQPPTGLTADAGAYVSGPRAAYGVSAIDAMTDEESLVAIVTDLATLGTSTAPVHLTWVPVVGARAYRVYSGFHGEGGPVGPELLARKGETAAASYTDVGQGWIAGEDGDLIYAPTVTPIFTDPDEFPATAAFYKQRVVFGGPAANPSRVVTSRIGSQAMTISSPLQDDDSVRFTLLGRGYQAIRHFVELQRLIVMTSAGEWILQGDENGVLTPTTINADQEGQTGSSTVPPVVIGSSLIYLQARDTILRDFRFEQEIDGYSGRDLTIFATHLFEHYTITRLAYAQIPHSVIWAIRSDGTLLGLTYLREHEIWGWHRHDTGAAGRFEDVCTLPSGTEDVVYVIVNRTIGGVTQRYIERLASRRIVDFAQDAFFVDSGLTYDGRNHGATTVTLTGAGWTQTDLLTVTASAAVFVGGDVGNDLVLEAADGDVIRVRLQGYTSATVMTGYPHRTVPADLRATPTTAWARAVDVIAGLEHLEGELLAVLGDSDVVFNGDPDDPVAETFRVTGGAVTLPRPYAVIHAGLPIQFADAETLALDVQGTSLRDKRKNLKGVTLIVEETRGIFVGPDADHLQEAVPELADHWGQRLPTSEEDLEVNIAATWNRTGRLLIRQANPLPVTILAAIPAFDVGG